jgi:proline dehydrogenase
VFREAVLLVTQRSSVEDLITRKRLFRPLVRRFVAGEGLVDAIEATRALNASGLMVTLDHLGESVVDERLASEAAAAQLDLLAAINEFGLDANVSLKLTQLGLALDRELAARNLSLIVRRAHELGIFVRIDMESSEYTEKTLGIARDLRSDGLKNVGVVIQSCLHRSGDDIEDLIEGGMRVRLCKGAYAEHGDVAISSKSSVDDNFVRLAERLLVDGHYPAFATHDEKIVRHIVEISRGRGIDPASFEFQMLYGVRRRLQAELVAQGFRVRVYVPYGEAWYPYLTRRLAERPANLLFFLKSALRD